MSTTPEIIKLLPPPPLDPLELMNEEEKRKWIKGKKLGEGTYANVFLGHSRSDPAVKVAIKKIKVNKEFTDGMPPDAVREVKALQELNHPNIIRLYSVFASKDQNLSLVLEFLPRGDLETLMFDQNVTYNAADIKAWTAMMLRGVWFCHENFVLHRDIKPNNLLIGADGELKLADFGLARSFADPHQLMSPNVITRWYRPPELFFGARHYSGAVDVWSVGMVFAQLANRRAWITGGNDTEMVTLLHRELGAITDDVWPGVSTLPHYVGPGPNPEKPRDLQFYIHNFRPLGTEGCHLLMQTLMLDPKTRVTAKQALQHKYWFADPRPTPTELLPHVPDKRAVEKMAADLKRRPGVVDEDRGSKVARKLDFGAAR
ncbi:CMGC CDK CDK7 kinase [Zalerion maritima]|uniref:CMGC CDK CDK7 kinase n=1 Tax=Zalerion maritima TaxID=339359 RepID=A0AAD5RTS3_9PEZI|nr:CMGC CDK CDK7 kinase [Zalerion maritima]